MAKRKAADRVRLTLQVREQLRGRLEKAAREHDTSINLEAGARLEASFRDDDVFRRLESMFGGKATMDIALTLARVMHSAAVSSGSVPAEDVVSNWHRSADAFDRAIKAVIAHLQIIRPEEKKR